MNQHERNLTGFIDYFKGADANVDSLTLADASAHMLAFRKFFKTFIDEHNQKYDSQTSLHIADFDAKKIDDFLKKLELLLSIKPDGYLYDVVPISRSKLKDIYSDSSHVLLESMEATSVMQSKLSKLKSLLDTDIGDIR